MVIARKTRELGYFVVNQEIFPGKLGNYLKNLETRLFLGKPGNWLENQKAWVFSGKPGNNLDFLVNPEITWKNREPDYSIAPRIPPALERRKDAIGAM